MRVIEADDILAAFTPFALDAYKFLRIDVVPVLRRIVPGITAASGARDSLRAIVVEFPEEHSTALMRIGLFAMLPKSEVVGLRERQHTRAEGSAIDSALTLLSKTFR